MRVVPKMLAAPDGTRLSITLGRKYEVIGIGADDSRILHDGSDTRKSSPVLFEPECFEVMDARRPGLRVCEIGDVGERTCYPPKCVHPGLQFRS